MKKILLYTVLILAFVGCKENQWMDWKVQNEAWLKQNALNPDVKTTSTGLQYQIIADPTPQDARPSKTSYVTCDYTVRLINGNEIEGGQHKAQFYLGQVIPGFSEGCCLIHNNGDIRLFVPYYLGYDATKVSDNDTYNAEGQGTEGTSGYIPPYSTLIFDIHICGVTGSK